MAVKYNPTWTSGNKVNFKLRNDYESQNDSTLKCEEKDDAYFSFSELSEDKNHLMVSVMVKDLFNNIG